MNSKIIRVLKYLLGWPISIVAIGFIIKLILPQLPAFLSNIAAINALLLFYGISCFLVYFLLRSYIWHFLVKKFSSSTTFKESSYLWAISELKRYIPGSVISFLGRVVVFSEKGIEKKQLGKLLVFEAVLIVLGGLAISLLSLTFIVGSIFHQINSLDKAGIILLVLVGILYFILSTKNFKFFQGFDRWEKAYLVFLSATAFLFFGIGNFFVIGSFLKLPIPLFFSLSGFFTLSFLIGYLSIITPSGLGVREGITTLGLSKIITFTQSAFVSIISRIFLILSELIFVIMVSLLYKIKTKGLLAIENLVNKNKQLSILIVLSIIYTIYIATASFLRYDNFYAGRFDLGNMAQTVWNTSRGRVFVFTNPNGTSMISRLAFHADFLLIFLAPIYRLFPDPKTLLFVQTVVVAAGSIFVFLLAKYVLKNKNIALIFGFLYLINPSVERANLYDFHAVTLATTFLLGAYYFYSKRKYFLFSLFALLAVLTKEQIWLIIALFGLLLFLKDKKRLFGSALFIFCAGMFYYLVAFAIPKALGADHFALAYYSDLGDKPFSIIKTVFLSPVKVFGIILQPTKIHYLLQLFFPLGFLSLLSPLYLIFAIPDFLINLLSSNPLLQQIYYQYTAAITPFLFISAIYGAKNLLRLFPKINSNSLITYLMTVGLVTAALYGPLPASKDPNLDMFTKQVPNRDFIIRYLNNIPRRYSVAASNNIGSHLSQRQRIYTLPLGTDKADIIVFLVNETESPQSIEAEKRQLKKFRSDKNYKMTIEKGDFSVFVKKSL